MSAIKSIEKFKEAAEIIVIMEAKASQIDEEYPKVQNGNKSAAARVRKLTLELTKLGKQFRELTLEAEKE